MPTTGWIIVSVITSIISWVLLYAMYIVFFYPYLQFSNDVVTLFGTQYPSITPVVANLVSDVNAAFVIVGIGIFVLMYIVGFMFEPMSEGVTGF